jgi:hypothetical protein
MNELDHPHFQFFFGFGGDEENKPENNPKVLNHEYSSYSVHLPNNKERTTYEETRNFF